MKQFVLSIECENAAFNECEKEEVARILREVSDKLERGEEIGRVRDFNGNLVGEWMFTNE